MRRITRGEAREPAESSSARPAGRLGRLLFVRWVRTAGEIGPDRAQRAAQVAWLRELDRVGRLVAAGGTGRPGEHLLLLRAEHLAEAERVLRSDPFRLGPDDESRIAPWRPDWTAAGVNLVPAPARGAGRLTELQRISVFVRDQASASVWYRDVLGLEIREADPETDLLELSLGPGAAGLALVRPRPEWGEPHFGEASGRVGQGTGISFRTDSVQALELRLRHAGARVTRAARDEPWGGRSIQFSDPDGNEFLAFDRGPARAESPPRPARRVHRRRPAGPASL